jgi:hypothetical protein
VASYLEYALSKVCLPTSAYHYVLLDPIPQWNWVDLKTNYVGYADQLYGPPIGSETPRGLKQLVHVLDQILPGVGVKKRFYVLDSLTHQKIANILGNNGRSAKFRHIQVLN